MRKRSHSKEKLDRMLADRIGQSLEKSERDTDRDNFMSAGRPRECGLIDQCSPATDVRNTRQPGVWHASFSYASQPGWSSAMCRKATKRCCTARSVAGRARTGPQAIAGPRSSSATNVSSCATYHSGRNRRSNPQRSSDDVCLPGRKSARPAVSTSSVRKAPRKFWPSPVYTPLQRLAATGIQQRCRTGQKQHSADRPDRLREKTLLAQTLAACWMLPFVMADATTLTETGYVGEDVENIIQSCCRNTLRRRKAQRGIVY